MKTKPGPRPGSPQRGGNHSGKDRHMMLSVRVSADELNTINFMALQLGLSKADLIVDAVKIYKRFIMIYT